VLSFLALSLFASAHLSLGGKPLFGKALLDDSSAAGAAVDGRAFGRQGPTFANP
jgi:hypothetical protein